MNELFGIPIDTLLVIVAVGLAFAVATLAVLALRNRILMKLALRSASRRPGRSALIVVGLMLGTAIIAAALTTGDTMNHTVRATAVDSLGTTDETVAPKGAVDDIPGALGAATGAGWISASTVDRVAAAVADSTLVDGVTGAIVDQVSVQSLAERTSEPSVVLFATDPARTQGFAAITSSQGGNVSLADLGPAEVYLNRKAASSLHVGPGDRVVVFAAGIPHEARVRDVVNYQGTGTADAALLVSLRTAQRLFGHPDEIRAVLVSNQGDAFSGAAHTRAVESRLAPVARQLGLEVKPVKQDAIEAADEAGASFVAFFTTFGTFSIAAGILLIFLIFVMLAAERRGELGIARAIGTRRGHLVQMFTFEGAAYDLAAAAVGALLGALVAFGMVFVMSKAFGAADADEGLQIQFAVSWRSLAVSFAIGLLLTLVVVAVSAWRVSVMTISSAIRNLPEPPSSKPRRRLVGALGCLVLGVLLTFLGARGGSYTPLMLGISLVLMSAVPLLRLAGVPDRLAFTTCGIALVVFLLLPWRVLEVVFGQLAMDFSAWIVAGLLIVVGTVWVIVFNADVLLGAAARLFGRFRTLAPVLRMSIAYPLKARFRTGTTLAMFTLVVFTLVTGLPRTGPSCMRSESPTTEAGSRSVPEPSARRPSTTWRARSRRASGIDASDVPVVGSQSVLAVQAQAGRCGTGSPRRISCAASTRGSSSTRHSDSARSRRATDRAARSGMPCGPRRGSPWSTARSLPRRDNWNSASLPDFRLSGFYYEDGSFDADTDRGSRQADGHGACA